MEIVNKYQNGKIYKIVSPSNPELVYYGSTINKLCKRMGGHRKQSNPNTSKHIIEKGDAIILLVEEFPCDNKEKLNKREGWYILNHDCVNKRVEGRTRKEWINDNKDKLKIQKHVFYEEHKNEIKERSSKYRIDHIEECKEYDKEYKNNNKETIALYKKEYRKNNFEYIQQNLKEYKQLNKDKIKEQSQIYYEANKEKIKAYQQLNKEKTKLKRQEMNKLKTELKKAERTK